MINSAIIGYGTVGKATGSALGIKKYLGKEGGTMTWEEASKMRFLFLCLPTPTIDGNQDTSAHLEVLDKLKELNFGGIVINRSTCLPGTARRLFGQYQIPIVANPSFLTEKTAVEDEKNPDIIVLGADEPSWTKKVRGIYEARHKGGYLFETDSVTAEIIKYAVNCFYATKVIYVNQIYDICQEAGANYETVRKAMYARKWIGKNHLQVFFNDKRGAKGKCLGKDLEAFSHFSRSELLAAVLKINEQYKD